MLEEVSTSVKTLVAEVAADDASITITNAFSAVLDSAVTAVENVNAANSNYGHGFNIKRVYGGICNTKDVASEIKAAAEAEVEAPGSGAAWLPLLTLRQSQQQQ